MGSGSGCASSFDDVVKNREMEVGQSFNATVDGHKFNIAREADVGGNRSFVVKVLA
jgi:hypothetical protein